VSAEVFISYDGDLLAALSASTSNTLLTGNWSVETNIVEGAGTNIDTIKMAMATNNDVLVGAGTLINIDFLVADVRTPASSPLTLEHVLFNDGTPGNTTLSGCAAITRHFESSASADRVVPLRQRVCGFHLDSMHLAVADLDASLVRFVAEDRLNTQARCGLG
jgi:hypothetical protein